MKAGNARRQASRRAARGQGSATRTGGGGQNLEDGTTLALEHSGTHRKDRHDRRRAICHGRAAGTSKAGRVCSVEPLH